MPGPRALAVIVSEEEGAELERLARRHTTPQQIALRARIVLRAAEAWTNAAIGRELEVDTNTVRAWRTQWNDTRSRSDLSVRNRLSDRPRSGRHPRITAEQVCRIVALTCEAPDLSGRPITQWTGREIADEVIRRGIVEQISPRHASRLVKRGIYNPTGSAAG